MPRSPLLRKSLSVSSAFALAAALGAASYGPSEAPTAGGEPAQWQPGADYEYINYTPPHVEPDHPDELLPGELQTLQQTQELDQKFSSGNPAAAQELARREERAVRTGENPGEWLHPGGQEQQEAQLLTILVEFDENADDDFSGWERPVSTADTTDCVVEPEGTLIGGPLHNEMPDPADAPVGTDNNTMWVPDFSTEHYNSLLYTEEGITERVRPDLTGPDGDPGVDISGYTMKNMYEEMSGGAYTVAGEATPWVTVPHSEAWYGAGACNAAPQNMSGHPDNPLGASQLPIDAVDALAEQVPDFPWEDYDIEDPTDADDDGVVDEPDGVIDHMVLVHAGKGKSSGGGAQGTYALWAHAGTVVGGHDIPGTDLQAFNYILQPEDAGVGVFAHEYGHDLGLPDLYDTSGAGESDVNYWDLMAAGSHTGPLFQSMPTHMGVWDKWVLGWADPVEFNPGDRPRYVQVGPAGRTRRSAQDGVRINLPEDERVLAEPHSGEAMWWSGNDQNWADVRLAREIDVPDGDDVRFWLWNDYTIEEDWDFGFIEVSTDGGATWEEQLVYDEAGNVVSTDDDYTDPNGRMADYGGKVYGLTGDTGGWRHDYVDLAPFAGESIQLRLRYATDAAWLERGWFGDDFSVTVDEEVVWSDDVEEGEGDWTAEVDTFTDTSGTGWSVHGGTVIGEHFYLAEWRALEGFDEGLQYAYDTTYFRDGVWNVERTPYNAPGLLLWYRNTGYGEQNHVAVNSFDPPSIGAKGALLVVDANYEPLRRTGEAAEADPSELKNIGSRPQSSNAAFGLAPTQPFTECFEASDEPFSAYCTDFGAQDPVAEFTDAVTWYPGIEVRGEDLFYRDRDASAVIPAEDHQMYTTRAVNPDGTPATEWYGTDLGGGHLLGTGNPGDEDKAMGVELRVARTLFGDQTAIVRVTPGG